MKAFPNYKLILLPGLDGTGMLFEPFRSAFLDQSMLQVISYPVNQELNYDELAQIVRKQLPKSEKFILLAESFSGPVAARFQDHPQLIATIFCASFVKSPRPFISQLIKYLPISPLVQIPCPAFVLRLLCLGWRCPKSIIDLFYKTLRAVDPKVLAYRLRMLANVDELSCIASSSKPICCLVPTRDRLVPMRCAGEIERVGGNVTFKLVKGRHFLLQSSPIEAIASLKKFLRGLEGRSLSS